MRLYHYSKKHYSVLKTRRQQGVGGPEGVSVGEGYLDHISFFFDPVPLELLPDIFDRTRHPVWFKGNELYEHQISVASLDEKVLYQVVESARRTALLDKFSEENDWTKDDPTVRKKWDMLINRMQSQWGEIGDTRAGLIKQIKQLHGSTKAGFMIAKSRADFADGYTKYAANVPHVMLYPASGEIQVVSSQRVTVGSAHT